LAAVVLPVQVSPSSTAAHGSSPGILAEYNTTSHTRKMTKQIDIVEVNFKESILRRQASGATIVKPTNTHKWRSCAAPEAPNCSMTSGIRSAMTIK
jgi:hypothetical protein